MKKLLSTLAVIAFTALTLSSCASKEEKVLNKLDDLAEKVEKVDGIENVDWDDLQKDYEEIATEAQDCNFTQEQQTEFAQKVGKIQGLMLKKTMKSVTDGTKTFMDAAGDFAKGLSDGFNSEDE